MASYDASPAYQRWLAVERQVIVNQVAYYNHLVGTAFSGLSYSRTVDLRLFNAERLNRARAHLALGDRLHELRRLTQTVRVLTRTRTLPLALVFASELWRAELETVAAQHAALGPLGADPGPGPFLYGRRAFGPFLPS
jgi:diadenosine tetraphosphatase ApaH/serine/threonine PP2A family protein phosphatase